MNSNNHRLVCLVVVYGKEYSESATLRSLLRTDLEISKLIIQNNGPRTLNADSTIESLRSKYKNIKIVQEINNAPLSHLYNDFIDNLDSDWYMILDDDTVLPESYETHLSKKKTKPDIILPIIRSRKQNKIIYPVVNNNAITECNDFILKEGDSIFSIGSALIISDRVKHLFKNKSQNIFDNRYAIYGVDFSFFRRLKNINLNGDITLRVTTQIEHDLSSDNIKQEKWRVEERIIDAVLTLRHYSDKPKRNIVRYIINTIKRRQYKSIGLIIKTFIIARHPACNKRYKKCS